MAKKKKTSKKAKNKAQANKKLITVIVAVTFLTVAIVGGFWFVNVYQGAARNINAGNVMMEEGEYKAARKMYGRAVKKEPSNLGHITKLQEAILSIVPKTVNEARALYNEYLGTLVHKTRYSLNDADIQFALIYELHSNAILTSDLVYWNQLQAQAEAVLDRLPLDDPRRYEAKIYRGLAFLHIDNRDMTDTFDEDGHIRFPGELDLLDALESDPGNELAWSALSHGRMSVYYRLLTEGRVAQAEKNRGKAEQTMQEAMEAAGDSLEMAIVFAQEALLHRTRFLDDNRTKPGTHTAAEIEGVSNVASIAIDAIVASFDPELHNDLTAQVASILFTSGEVGRELSVKVFKSHIETHPNDFQSKLLYASLLYRLQRNDEAEEVAKEVLEAPQLTVGVESIVQFALRPQSANLLFLVARDRADAAKDKDERERLISLAKERRDTILELVSGDLFNGMILGADGDLAFLQKNYRLASSKYEELISRFPYPKSGTEVYAKTSICLLRSGVPGLAKNRIEDALTFNPSVISYQLQKAHVEIALSDFEGAYETLIKLPKEFTAERPEISEMLDTIALRTGSKVKFNDPVAELLSSISTLISQGKEEEAILQLHHAIETFAKPDWRLYRLLSAAYHSLKDDDNAIVWIEKAIALQPDMQVLKQMKTMIYSDNLVTATIALIEESDTPEKDKPTAISIRLFRLSARQAQIAIQMKRNGKEQEAKKAKELSELALSESEKYQKIALESGADPIDLLFVQFNSELKEKNYSRAQKILDQAKEGGADPLVLATNEVILLLSQLNTARANGESTDALIQRAREIAEHATDTFAQSAITWRLLGEVLEFEGNDSEAHDSFSQAYQLAPTDSENAKTYLRSLLIESGDIQRIMRVVHDARAAFPNDAQLEETWLALEAKYGDKSKVLRHRMKKHAFYPEDQDNALQFALFLMNTTPERTMMLNAKLEEVFTLQTWSRFSSKKQEEEIRRTKATWEEVVDTIIVASKTTQIPDLRTALMHAAVERTRGRMNEVSVVLDQYLEQVSGSDSYASASIAIASFYQESKSFLRAKGVLEEAMEFQSEKMEISAALGSLLLMSGGTEELGQAEEELARAAKATDSLVTYTNWVQALIRLQKFDEAMLALQDFEGSNIEYSKTMLESRIHKNKSEIMLAQGKFSETKLELEKYRALLSKAIKLDSANRTPYLELCNSLLSEFSLTQNKDMLEEALDLIDQGEAFTETSEDFVIVQTNVFQADGQLRRAIESLNTFLTKKPSSVRVRERLIEAHLDADDFEKAVAVTSEGVLQNPTSAVWHQKLGDLYHRAIDDRAKAAQCYLDALALEPSIQLVYRLDTVTKTDQILPYRNILKATRESIATLHPIVGSIEAKVLLGLGQRRDSEIAMEKSWNAYQQQIQKKQLPPSSIISWFANLAIIFNDDPELGEAFVTRIIGSEPAPDELLGLASYWWELDRAKVDYSISILDQIIENPSFSDETKVSAIMTKGAFLIEDGRYEAGEKIYRKLAQAKPNNPLILNNLAYVVGVYLNKPEEGLVIAMEAARLAPRHPSIIDTISKIHELMGDFQKAAETLDYLLQIDPINAKVMARLSLLYAERLDQAERAVLLAQRARSQQPRSPEALDALGWSYIQLGQVAKGEKFLQRSIANGETAIAYIHMAQLVMNEGEYDEALGHIRLAEELSRDQYTLDRIRSIKDDIRKKQTFVGQ